MSSGTLQDYPFQFKTALICHSVNSQAFAEGLLAVDDHGCDICITQIFDPQSLQGETVNLDQCFIPSHEVFPRRQLKRACPLLPTQHPQFIKFILDYILYLGVKQVAIKYSTDHHTQLIQTVAMIQRSLRKGNTTIICLVTADSNAQTALDVYRSFIDFRRQVHKRTSIACQVCLTVQQNLPEKWVLQRWAGQNVVYLSLSQNCFVMNNKGYPVLSKTHESTVISWLRRHCNIGLEWKGGPLKGLKSYLNYFQRHLLEKAVGGMSPQQIQAQGQINYWRDPLQPYIDNLEAQIYDIFEQDTLKYTIYGEALLEAFHSFSEDKFVTVYYVGCGKGQILKKVIQASKQTKKKVKVYCLDKNPYPLQTVKRRVSRQKWQKFVEVVQADIKTYEVPQHPDIIVSELLGGFGCNELSPECIRWAEKWATKDTIIIPQKYTSFIRPISSQTFYSKLPQSDHQSYFVVKFGLHYSPFASQPVWSFSHPLDESDDLQREGSCTWKAPYDIAIQGLEATFDCNLWGKAYFSIVAETHNKNFFSWFPWFIAFEGELVMEKDDELQVWIARRTEKSCVWYQWRYEMRSAEGEVYVSSEWHNRTGKTAVLLEQ